MRLLAGSLVDMGRLKMVRFLAGEKRVIDLVVGSDTGRALQYVNAPNLVYVKNARFIGCPKVQWLASVNVQTFCPPTSGSA